MKKDISWKRDVLEQRLSRLSPKDDYRCPNKGWLAAMREVLGMTAAQLGQRMGVSAANVTQLEHRERLKSIQLGTLEKAAAAVGCDLVYMLVPKTSLEQFVQEQARKKAKEYFRSVSHSMSLEQQSLDKAASNAQMNQLIADLVNNPKELWS